MPTYNRANVLRKTLLAYKEQTAADQIAELLVVDDGSTDDTETTVAQAASNSPFPIRFLSQNHGGPAKARNYAIRESRGDLLLMGDDDIIPAPGLVAEHLGWHEANPADFHALLGLVVWSPEVNPTPFMEWLGRDGVLFGFRYISSGSEVGPAYFYSCNLSIKTRFLLEHGMFDEDFPLAACEDTELGSRLAQRGLRLFYNADAVGFHHRRMTYSDLMRRTESLALALQIYRRKVTGSVASGGTQPAAPPTKRALRKLASLLSPTMPLFAPLLDTHIPLPRMFYSAMYRYHIFPLAQARARSGLD